MVMNPMVESVKHHLKQIQNKNEHKLPICSFFAGRSNLMVKVEGNFEGVPENTSCMKFGLVAYVKPTGGG